MARLFNFPSNDLRNQLLNEILQRPTCRLLLHNIHHPFPDLSNLRRLRIRCLLHLIRSSFRECNDKDSQEVSIRRLDIRMRLNESLPFTYERLEFVRGKGHAAEIGEAVFALDFVDAEFDFAEGVVLVGLEVCQGDFKDAAFECVVGGFCGTLLDLLTGGAIYSNQWIG